MGVRQGRLEIQGELLVELVVILLFYLARRLAPDSGLAVGLFGLFPDINGEGYEVGVLAHDFSQAVFFEKFFGVFFQLDDHIGAALGFFGCFDGKGIGPGAEPGCRFRLRTVRAGDNPDPLGCHESRIEADAKLPD